MNFAARSEYLHNTATQRALGGVDGIYLINLKRRSDRLRKFKQVSQLYDNEFHVFEAVDGKALEWTDELQYLFRNNDFDYRTGIAGCALSHLHLWQHIATTQNELHLIFEDDAIIEPDIIHEWNTKYFPILPRQRSGKLSIYNVLFDKVNFILVLLHRIFSSALVFLGGVVEQRELLTDHHNVTRPVNKHFREHIPAPLYDSERPLPLYNAYIPAVDDVIPLEPRRIFFYTGIAYMLSSSAARELISMVSEKGLAVANDMLVMRLLDRIVPGCYVVDPLLVRVPPSVRTDRIHADDTDIQDGFSPVTGAPPKSGPFPDPWIPCLLAYLSDYHYFLPFTTI